MGVAEYVRALLASDKLGPQVRHHRCEPARAAVYAESRLPWPAAIRRTLEERGLSGLYSHQALATDHIRAGHSVVVATPTASGKSLIYNLPVLERHLRDSEARALYLFPLKALAQDQLAGLQRLVSGWPEEARPTAALYDGDTSDHFRRKIRRDPPTVLISNPEMLHLALLPHHEQWAPFLAGLSHIVVDEAHTYRGVFGAHMAGVFRRLNRLAAHYGAMPSYVFCTATVGNPGELAASLSGLDLLPGRQPPVVVDQSGAPQGARHYVFLDPDQSPATAAIDLLRAALARKLRTIVYCRSRRMTELVSLWAGSLSGPWAGRISAYRAGFLPEERRQIEARMASGELLAVVSTSALELGIDIGRLERAFQVDAPFTVSGFLQRMGRTGRRGDPCEMWFVMREDHPEPRAMLPQLIPWYLIQGIALVQLYIEERFVEPPRTQRLPYSLLYHQTMSTLASCGEMTPAELATRVLTLSSFHLITQDDYRILLRHLIKIGHIDQTENGGLIIGLEGERIVNNYKFYAVFQENVEYAVRAGAEELGTIVKPPPIGDKIAIAGRVWVVEEVDHRRREVYCTLVKGNIPAYFGDVAGDIHTRILERMYGVLKEQNSFPYLMRHAVCRLQEARESFAKSGMRNHPLVHLGGNMWALFPWLGSYAFLALERLLKIRCKQRLGLKGLDSLRPYYLQFTMKVSASDFYRIMAEEAEQDFDPLELVYPNEVPNFEKYDEYVPAELVRKGFALGVLDVEGMKQSVRSWSRYVKDN